MSGKISQDQTVPFKASLFIPGVDLTLPAGQRNIKLQAGSIGSLATTPQQYGAVGDGVTDCTAAFNAALAAIAAQGGNGKLYIPSGHYKISGPLTYNSGYLLVQGDGPATELDYGSTTADMMTFTGTNVTLSDFRVVTPYQTSSGGALFNFKSASYIRLDRLTTNGGYEVVQFLGSASNLSYRTSITNCFFDNVMSNCVFYDQYFGGIGMISDTEMLAAPNNSTTGNGIIVEAGDTFNFTNVNIQGFPEGIELTSKTGGINYIANVFAANVLCDGGGGAAGLLDGWIFDGSMAGTYVTRIHLSGCWAGSEHRHGFYVFNATEVTFANCVAISNTGHGFFITTPSSDITLNGCTALGNSLGSANTNDGVHIIGPVVDFIITGCRLKPIAPSFGAATQRYGVFVDGSANNRYIISNNDLNGNVTAGLSDSGTGATKFVSQNIT